MTDLQTYLTTPKGSVHNQAVRTDTRQKAPAPVSGEAGVFGDPGACEGPHRGSRSRHRPTGRRRREQHRLRCGEGTQPDTIRPYTPPPLRPRESLRRRQSGRAMRPRLRLAARPRRQARRFHLRKWDGAVKGRAAYPIHLQLRTRRSHVGTCYAPRGSRTSTTVRASVCGLPVGEESCWPLSLVKGSGRRLWWSGPQWGPGASEQRFRRGCAGRVGVPRR